MSFKMLAKQLPGRGRFRRDNRIKCASLKRAQHWALFGESALVMAVDLAPYALCLPPEILLLLVNDSEYRELARQ
jgi:hypothetical protein